MPNHLVNEKSLYLRQHANNPVNWYPWGDEAFAKAKELDKPIIISIGYSACHWCHVMARESFENEYIASIMNEHFVCIKVDREERPDVDQIYMEAVQMITQSGGWPLNVFCFPDGRPFFGGTYFPPEDRGQGMVPWPQLLMRISDFYTRNRDQLEENADSIVQNLAASNTPMGSATAVINAATLVDTAIAIAKNHDDQFGGFGNAPKFPPAMTLDFFMQVRNGDVKTEDPVSLESSYKRIDEVLDTTLTAMAHGGLYDQIGGGFTRYSVDKFWLIPHFEKMMYDNGLLLETYAKAYLNYRKPIYKAIVEETAEWALREMRTDAGSFYATIDAQSEGVEGKFYVWTLAEIKEVLGEEEGNRFAVAYNITEEGNFEHGQSNPALTEADFAVRESFTDARQKLFDHREKRVHPGIDKKQPTAWNSLIISGLVEAGFALDRQDFFDAAKNCADFIWENLRTEDNRLFSIFYEESNLNGYQHDYAYYADALLKIAAYVDFYYPGESKKYIGRAEIITAETLKHFKDPNAVGFFFTSNDHEALVTRKKEWWDNSTPSGNSAMLHVLSSLFYITAKEEYQKEFTALRRAYPGLAERGPMGIPHALSAIAADINGIEVIKAKQVTDFPELANEMRKHPWARRFAILSEDPINPVGYLRCKGTLCYPPKDTPKEIFEFAPSGLRNNPTFE